MVKSLETIRQTIVNCAEKTEYDHRLLMPDKVKQMFPHMLEPEQLQYSRFKFAVAFVLDPDTIYEVGVGWGVSLNAFHAGNPGSAIHGIDSGEMGVDPYEVAFECNCANMNEITVERASSNNLPKFDHPAGPIDLIHIDGGHGLEHKADDLVKAFEARPEWILVDDMSNVMVAAGTFAGIYRAAANSTPADALQMMYFGDSHTGNLLIHVERKAPEYRGLKIERT